MPGAFSASKLFDLETTLYNKLGPLVGSVALPETIKRTPVRSPEYQTGSSQYASATSEAGSDSSVDLERMTLGPSGAAMLQERQANAKLERSSRESTPAVTPARSPEQMQTFFNAAMNRYLKEKQTGGSKSTADGTGQDAQDVEMESIESYHASRIRSGQLEHRYTATSSGRIRRSSRNTDIHFYSGKDQDEDRARSWLGKVKSAFVRDQAPDSEKCLMLGDLLTGPARNWYRQLSRSTRSNWKSLLEAFQTQYCGRGVSVARQYYHAKKRSDESPMEYLHRLNVAGMRARLQIKDGPAATRREHVEHFIETLDDRDLADQLALLRLTDAKDLEETLRARQRAKA
ncbi:hypothetical protein PHMEG_00040508, partial [Phytophthora megakarya]